MPHQFTSIKCKECGTHYCPVCKEVCPNCGKDGIEKDEYRRYIENWRRTNKEKIKRKEFYTAEELAERLQLNIMTIYRYIKAGKFKAHKIGKEYRIDRTEFERFINSAKTK